MKGYRGEGLVGFSQNREVGPRGFPLIFSHLLHRLTLLSLLVPSLQAHWLAGGTPEAQSLPFAPSKPSTHVPVMDMGGDPWHGVSSPTPLLPSLAVRGTPSPVWGALRSHIIMHIRYKQSCLIILRHISDSIINKHCKINEEKCDLQFPDRKSPSLPSQGDSASHQGERRCTGTGGSLASSPQGHPTPRLTLTPRSLPPVSSRRQAGPLDGWWWPLWSESRGICRGSCGGQIPDTPSS